MSGREKEKTREGLLKEVLEGKGEKPKREKKKRGEKTKTESKKITIDVRGTKRQKRRVTFHGPEHGERPIPKKRAATIQKKRRPRKNVKGAKPCSPLLNDSKILSGSKRS